MRVNAVTTTGAIWIVFGLAGAAWDTLDLVRTAVDPEVGLRTSFFGLGWWVTQSLFPVFFICAFVGGVGLVKQLPWAIGALRWLSLIMLLYTVAYTLLAGDRAPVYVFIGIASAVVAAASVAVAFGKVGKHAS